MGKDRLVVIIEIAFQKAYCVHLVDLVVTPHLFKKDG